MRSNLYRAYGCNGKFIAVFCCNLWYLVDESCRRHKRVLTVRHCCASGMIRFAGHGNVITVHPRDGGYDADRSTGLKQSCSLLYMELYKTMNSGRILRRLKHVRARNAVSLHDLPSLFPIDI